MPLSVSVSTFPPVPLFTTASSPSALFTAFTSSALSSTLLLVALLLVMLLVAFFLAPLLAALLLLWHLYFYSTQWRSIALLLATLLMALPCFLLVALVFVGCNTPHCGAPHGVLPHCGAPCGVLGCFPCGVPRGVCPHNAPWCSLLTALLLAAVRILSSPPLPLCESLCLAATSWPRSSRRLSSSGARDWDRPPSRAQA